MRTVVDPRFRGLLANLVQASDAKRSAIAAEADISQATLSSLLNGTRNPSPKTARDLDRALNADGQLAALVATVGRDEDLDRLAAVWRDGARNANEATAQSLAAVLASQRHLDDAMGSAALIKPMLAQMDTVNRLVAGAPIRMRPRFVDLLGQYAQFIGWLYTSVGHNDEARTWFNRSLTAAMEVADGELSATVLSYQGHVAWLGAQWEATIGLANAALRDRTIYPGQRAYDAFQAARAHAALGDLEQARRMMTLGDELAAAADLWVGRVPPWQYYRAPWFWSLERGLVYRYMARHDVQCAPCAVSYLKAGIEGMPEGMRAADWTAEYMVHLGKSYAAAGADESAGEWLARAKQIAVDVKSPRVTQLARMAERSLEYGRH